MLLLLMLERWPCRRASEVVQSDIDAAPPSNGQQPGAEGSAQGGIVGGWRRGQGEEAVLGVHRDGSRRAAFVSVCVVHWTHP